MQGWNKPMLAIMLVLLLVVPLAVELWLLRGELDAARRNYRLCALYEYNPLHNTSKIDFDGDGNPEFMLVERLPRLRDRWLTIARNDGMALLRLPFDNADGSKGTHAAIVYQAGTPHLLVYDRVSYAQPLSVVYAFDGRSLSQIPASPLERQVLSAMAARDGKEEWSQRESLVAHRIMKLVCYYFALAVIGLVVFYRRYVDPNARCGYRFLRGHP